MSNLLKTERNGEMVPFQTLAILILFTIPSFSWGLVEAIPGDVNKDGAIDILDIQNGINIAIGIGEQVSMADVNQNSMVDVMDIQLLVNTVLGTGGLIQPVEGQLPADFINGHQGTPFNIVALSEDGRVLTSEVSSTDGTFHISLPIGVQWTLGILGTSGDNQNQSMPFVIPAGIQNVLSIPLLQLSTGQPLLLNNINIQQSNMALPDIRSLLGSIAEPLPNTDENGNHIPDIYEQLINSIEDNLLSISLLQGLGVNETMLNQLLQNLGTCVQPQTNTLLTPSLNQSEGYPEMVFPLIQCLEQMLKDYLTQSGIPNSGIIVDTLMNQLQGEFQQQIFTWLDTLQIPEVTDSDRNYIPDFIENHLCTGTNCQFDLNGNGVPDFIEDSDGDGIPNFLDPDNRSEQDTDGDGIPNEQDIDANGNGQLDYAENSTEK